MKHIAWDKGVVTEEATAMLAIELGVWLNQKTCKTQCGRRVKMANIDNRNADCEECRAKVIDEARRDRAGMLDVLRTMPEADHDPIERAIAYCEETIQRYN